MATAAVVRVITREKVLIGVCDGCGVRRIGDGEDPVGFFGTVRHVHGTGATAMVKWFACIAEHVGVAVQAALARESEKADHG